jgi:amidase
MGRTVEDVAICLGSLVGIDPEDSKTLESEGLYESDYTRFLKQDGLKGKRIGLLTNVMGYHHKVDILTHKSVAYLESQGLN